jgi:5-methylcytosine-specific restriction endonuclease McrA
VTVAYSLGRAGTKWNRLRAQVFAEETHCWICRYYVDQALPRTHAMSRTVDHVVPLWRGGPEVERTNCRLAHRRCNTIRNNQLRAQLRGGSQPAFTVDATTL